MGDCSEAIRKRLRFSARKRNCVCVWLPRLNHSKLGVTPAFERSQTDTVRSQEQLSTRVLYSRNSLLVKKPGTLWQGSTTPRRNYLLLSTGSCSRRRVLGSKLTPRPSRCSRRGDAMLRSREREEIIGYLQGIAAKPPKIISQEQISSVEEGIALVRNTEAF